MKKKREQKAKGITLIALVVTIVVLLILAGVSISMLGGENGIIKQAVESKYKTKIGDEKERVGLAATAAKTENNWGEITEENLAAELTKNIGERDVDYTLTTSGEKFKVTYTDTGNNYLVDKNGNTTECGPWTQGEKDSNGNIPITNGKITLEVGDIIDYDPLPDGETARTYTSKTVQTGYSTDQTFSSAYGGTWKVIGVSDEGQILITPTDVIEKTKPTDAYYYLRKQDGYKNAVNELDKISEIFGHGYGAVGARSITVEDINKVTGYNPNNVGQYDPNQTGSGTKYSANQLNEYGNEMTYYWKGDDYPHYIATNGLEGNLSNSHNVSSGNYGFNWYEKGWKHSLKSTTATTSNMEEITTLRSNDYWYYPQTLTNTSDTSATEGITTSSKAYKAIFCNSSESTDNYGYWLGSPFVATGAGVALFGMHCVRNGYVFHGNLYNSDGATNGYYYGVRPAVILKSDIQLTGSSTEGWTIVKN